ncbi:MucR family transcriptional regulator [Geobacter sp. AOG2]|uniref:MucR family transcriptional regulator n=1 Tax=Geobacter sp. AOG2 TaxID=1566347 RepID=UPI001CC3A8F9|nr:MucR family transcriptional regulator [Geobacter sp. AOG2]GFE59988.1 hypothetical protein AOG2_05760 [Geobacter sp. AOG2]
MPTLLELTVQIVSSHALSSDMTQDQLLEELQKVHASLKAIESGTSVEPATKEQPKLTIKQAFKKDEIICMVCGQRFKTLKRHLAQAHDLKPGQYRKQFSIPSSMSLTAKSYSESRRQTAVDKGLGEGLAKARELRAAKAQGEKAPVPAVRVKPAVPAVRVKASVPAIKTKAPVQAKTKKVSVPAKKSK